MAVYKEENKKKIPKNGNCWYYRVYYTDMYGNRKQKQSKMYATKKEAQEEERKFLNNINSHEDELKNITFEQVYEEWFKVKGPTLKCTTLYRKKGNSDLHILKELQEFKLQSINKNILEDWLEKLKEKKYSIKYTNELISYLLKILTYACDNYNFNSKSLIVLQPVRDDNIKEAKSDAEWNFWTYDEFKIFIDNVDNSFYNLLFNFLYYTGLRYGEMNALNWNDIDFKNKTLSITKSLSNKIKGQNYIITTPKTENSVRIIDLDDNLIKLLKIHYNKENKLYNFSDSMFVFGNVNYIPATTFRRYLDHYIKVANIKKITPHGFRHSHVSFLIDIGCDVRDVAERIGDTVEMVEKTYYHMFPQKKSSTVKAINNFINKK